MPTKKPVTFSARLAQLREHAGITVYRLSKQSGVSPQYIWQLERGVKFPSLEIARKLAKALGHGLGVWD